jgi:hypothetical protein
MPHLTKIYIGCALTQAPAEFTKRVEALKDQLRAEFYIFDFVGLIDGTPAEVYQSDIQTCIAQCDLFVAICDYPAIGLGYELGTAIEKWGKPVLAVAHHNAHVTRLILGVDAANYSFERYGTLEEVPDLIRAKLTQH